jgi:hypothetical protein
VGTRDRAKGVEPEEAVAARVRKLIASEGEAAALSRLQMSSQTVARIGAGMRVNRSSIELAKLRIEEASRG